MQNKIGLFGGSFSPIHIGHLIIASIFVQKYYLHKCIFIPNYLSPFKKTMLKHQIPTNHRTEMIKLAIDNDKRFDMDTIEIQKEEISYTYRTIQYFKTRFQDAELFFLIGDDQAVEFTKWKNWRNILQNTNIVIARRTYNLNYPLEVLNKIDKIYHSKFLFLENPFIEISSSYIRDLIASGKDFRYFVPTQVYNYILKNQLYIQI